MEKFQTHDNKNRSYSSSAPRFCIRFEVESSGGNFDRGQAVRDGKVISAQTWQSHPEFYREIFAALGE